MVWRFASKARRSSAWRAKRTEHDVTGTLRSKAKPLSQKRHSRTYGGNAVPTDHVKSLVLRSTLISVAELDRSIDFYRAVGSFELIFREDAIAVVGGTTAESIVLILRATRSIRQTRQCPQSVGLRSMTFSVGSLGEMDRIESALRDRDLFISRGPIADGASEILRGRDPDNLPLVFVCYAEGTNPGSDYYRKVVELMYSLDA
jgi:hypothetical protein